MSILRFATPGLSLALTLGITEAAYPNSILTLSAIQTAPTSCIYSDRLDLLRRVQAQDTDVLGIVKELLVEHLGIDTKTQTLYGRSFLIADLGADSLDMVEVIMALEEKFSIEIPDNSWLCRQRDISVDDLVKFVKNPVPAQNDRNPRPSKVVPGAKTKKFQ